MQWRYRLPLVRNLRIFIDSETRAFKERVSIIKALYSVGEQNEKLEEEIAQLKVSLMMNEGVKRENEELSKLLKIKDTYAKYTVIPAKLLNYSSTNPNIVYIYFAEKYKNIISQRATVVSSMGLVGLVTSFSENSAEVELVTSKQFNLPAILESREECSAVIKGNGTSLNLYFLDKVCSKPSISGKKLLSANISQNLSLPYIPVGTIGNLYEDENNMLFMKGDVTPLFKQGRLSHLFIIAGDNLKTQENGKVEEKDEKLQP